jgi:hypothetical protein
MCSFWAGGISSFPFSRAREYRLLRRLVKSLGYNGEIKKTAAPAIPIKAGIHLKTILNLL